MAFGNVSCCLAMLPLPHFPSVSITTSISLSVPLCDITTPSACYGLGASIETVQEELFLIAWVAVYGKVHYL